LTVDHLDLAVVRGSRKTRVGSSASHVANHGLSGEGALRASVAATAKEAVEELADLALVLGVAGVLGVLDGGDIILLASGTRGSLVGRGIAGSHEGRDDVGGVDRAVALGAAQGTGLAGAELPVADDGRVGLRAAAVGRAVTRSAVGNYTKVS
jgi:hypothetical protein